MAITRYGITYTVNSAEALRAAPRWVLNNEACRRMWEDHLGWRCNAAAADTQQWKRQLRREAERFYGVCEG
jgi:hypothetical protein